MKLFQTFFLFVILIIGSISLLDSKIEQNKAKKKFQKEIIHLVYSGNINQLKKIPIENYRNIINANGENLLMAATEMGNKETVNYLLKKGFDLNEKDHQGHNAGYYLLKTDNGNFLRQEKAKIMDLFIRKNLDLNTKDLSNRSLFYYILQSENISLIKTTIQHRKREIKKFLKEDNYSALFNLAKEEKFTQIMLFIDYNIISAVIKDKKERNFYFFIKKDSNKSRKFFQYLIKKKVPVQEVDQNGYPPLMYHIKNTGNLFIIEKMINLYPDYPILKDGHSIHTLAFLSTNKKIIEITRKIPQVKIPLTNHVYNDMIVYYLKRKMIRTLEKFILNHKSKKNLWIENSTFEKAFLNGHYSIFNLILKNTLEERRRISIERFHEFLYTSFSSERKIMFLNLIDRYKISFTQNDQIIKPNYIHLVPPNISLLKWITAEHPDMVSKKDSLGRSSLMIHIHSGRIQILKFLVQNGSFIRDTDNHHRTLLMHATLKPSNERIILWILEEIKRDENVSFLEGYINQKDVFNKTALDYCEINKNYRNAKLLKKILRDIEKKIK